jgi:predicted transcriptional regulator
MRILTSDTADEVGDEATHPAGETGMRFADRELDVLGVLWDHGPSTALEVQRALSDRLAYTTVLSMLRILEAKGYARHAVEGKVHRFSAVVSRRDAARSMIDHLTLKLVGGSRERFLAYVLDTDDAA